MGAKSGALRFSDIRLGLGIPQCDSLAAPVGGVPENKMSNSLAKPGRGARNDSACGESGMEERGLRMTKAFTSIKVYCSQVYSPVSNAINQDLPSAGAIFQHPGRRRHSGAAGRRPGAPPMATGRRGIRRFFLIYSYGHEPFAAHPPVPLAPRAETQPLPPRSGGSRPPGGCPGIAVDKAGRGR